MSYWDEQFDEDPSLSGPRDYSDRIRKKFMDITYKEMFNKHSALNGIIDKMKPLSSESNGPEKDSLERIFKKAEYMMTQLSDSRHYEVMAKYKNVPMSALKSETKTPVNKFLKSHIKLGLLVKRTKDSSEDICLHKELDRVMALLQRMKINEIKNALNDTYDSDEDDVSDFDEE